MDSENYFSNNGRIRKKNERFIDDERGILTSVLKLSAMPLFSESTTYSSKSDKNVVVRHKDSFRNKREKYPVLTDKNKTDPLKVNKKALMVNYDAEYPGMAEEK